MQLSPPLAFGSQRLRPCFPLYIFGTQVSPPWSSCPVPCLVPATRFLHVGADSSGSSPYTSMLYLHTASAFLAASLYLPTSCTLHCGFECAGLRPLPQLYGSIVAVPLQLAIPFLPAPNLCSLLFSLCGTTILAAPGVSSLLPLR